MNPPDRIVVVGASAAGVAAVEELRRHGHQGSITLVGEEPEPPYDRPPLSKHLLSGAWTADRLTLLSHQRLADLDVTAVFGRAAVALDMPTRTVTLADGTAVTADAVVIATGCVARRPPGPGAVAGVHTLRTLGDALRLREELVTGRELTVVGSGFLGMEVAAVATAAGLRVSVVARNAPLAPAVGAAMAAALTDLHVQHGVRLELGRTARSVGSGDDGRPTVVLDDGRAVVADAVVWATGAAAAVGWLAGSGVPVDDGVLCDARLSAAPGVFAAGDVLRWSDGRPGRYRRVQHRLHAGESAAVVAQNLLGGNEHHSPVPFWWSDQYDARIQAYGWPSDSVHLWHGDLAARKAVVLFTSGGRVCGAVGWNCAKQVRAARALVTAAVPLEDAGPTTPLTVPVV